jgi:hypothetical protein
MTAHRYVLKLSRKEAYERAARLSNVILFAQWAFSPGLVNSVQSIGLSLLVGFNRPFGYDIPVFTQHPEVGRMSIQYLLQFISMQKTKFV